MEESSKRLSLASDRSRRTVLTRQLTHDKSQNMSRDNDDQSNSFRQRVKEKVELLDKKRIEAYKEKEQVHNDQIIAKIVAAKDDSLSKADHSNSIV